MVSVLLGNGDGTFSQPSTLDSAGCHPFVADFDGDSKLDVGVIGWGEFGCQFVGAGTILVFRGNGDGTFQPTAAFTTTSAWNLVATADLDGNKTPDLVTVGRSDNTVSVLLNSTGADFSISASAPMPATVSRGQSSTSTVTLAHLN